MLMANSQYRTYADQTQKRAVRPKSLFLNKFLLLWLFFSFCTCNDTLTPSKSVTEADVLVSSGQKFALGFFKPGNSTYRYLGIWFNKIPEKIVVWVANRDNPIKNNSSGVLKIISQGSIVILDKETNTIVWSTNSSINTRNNNSIAKLLDSGNLVLTRSDSENVVWQSFDYPTDTLLPGMKMGLSQRLGLNWSLTSWKSRDDPGSGNCSFVLDSQGSPEFFLYKGSDRVWRSGPWNGQRVSSLPELIHPELLYHRFINTPDEIYAMSMVTNSSIISRLVLDESGSIQGQLWNEENRRWNTIWSTSRDRCDSYAICGAYGSCGNNYPFQCSCLLRFEPKSPQDWNLGNGSGGCVRKRAAQYCGKGDGFLKLLHMKVPETSVSQVDMNLSLKECEQECLRNCNCTAYTSADIRGGGSGCMAWYGDLIDIREFPSGGQDLFFRVDAIEIATRDSTGSRGKKRTLIITLASLLGGLFLLVTCGCCFVQKRRNLLNGEMIQPDSPELPLFDFRAIALATDNFNVANKLGEGGFGPVYKGKIRNGHEIAVKRLSRSSGQGIEEFKNEVMLISKLQHKNLVRLLGCCVHGEERLLIYEFMPNRSLDAILFDATRRMLLDWSKRLHIVDGIARGLLYLHRDSRLRVIHRDLKASNILLDEDMNPKISDFGTARIFRVEQTVANTNKVVGTYGYMSPEYGMTGIFSEKSDVFSFGVLLLEIVSSKKCTGFYDSEQSLSFLGYAWQLWNEGKALELMDQTLVDSYLPPELIRCIHLGLLCVQEHAVDRPNMSTIVSMLGTETNLPTPKQPGFTFERRYTDTDFPLHENGIISRNSVTMTSLRGR